jgi:WD40 repeat protein
MTDLSAGGIEIVNIHRIRVDTTPIAVECFADTVAFILAEEQVLLISPRGEERMQRVHRGAILSSCATNNRLLTGGDDGQIVCLCENGRSTTLITDERRRWIDAVGVASGGSFAWSIGKEAFCRTKDGVQTSIQVPYSVGGLAFAHDRCRLAIAHYNGVTLWEPENESSAFMLSSKGSHLQPSFSPDGTILVCTMREPTLHAWSMEGNSNLQTPGYPRNVVSIDWTSDGRFLATSGTDRLTLLSFQIADNPLARMPLLLAPYSSLVSAVVCHPAKNIVAVGYSDGLVLLVRIPDGAEILIKAPDHSSIIAMRWSRSGSRLGIASENGQCRVVTVK